MDGTRIGRSIARRFREYLGGVQRRTAGGAVALTFDDGPQPGSTDRILDLLLALDVRATFFCVGKNALAHPTLVRRMADEGHSVGSHSLSHPHPKTLKVRELELQYCDGRAAVADVLQRDVPLFRPPHGHLTITSAAMLRRHGMQTWLWTVDPMDWRPGVAAPDITAVASLSGPGDVVLMHDWVEQPVALGALDRSATLAALPQLVRTLRDAHVEFERLEA